MFKVNTRGSDVPSATPARAREDADEGVRECLRLMTSGQWVAGQSHEEVAAKHGVSPATVKNWATNASRIIRLATDEAKEDIRARLVATLDNIVKTAMQKQGCAVGKTGEAHYFDAPDLRAAVSAVETSAKLLGLITNRHEVTQKPHVAHLTKEEHLEELEKLTKEIALEQERVRAEVLQ